MVEYNNMNKQLADKTEMKELIERRLQNFFGYGSLGAPVWFVGMEEGLGHKTDIEKKLAIRFRAADGKHTIDMRRDLIELTEHMKWFVPGGSIQPTWKYPIALYLYLKNGKEVFKEHIRAHQIEVLGDIARKVTTTVELMPLPSQKADESTWLYKKYGIDGLSSRKDYLATYKKMRALKLRELIGKHKPRLIIFFSLGYRKDWEFVMGAEAKEVTPQFFSGETNGTVFCIMPQSSMPGMSYDRLFDFAKKIKKRIHL